RVAKKRQASETAIPAVRRSALRRRFLPGPSGRRALSPARRRDESAARRLPPERPQARARGDRAAHEQRGGQPLPLAVEPEPEPEHEHQEAERAPCAGRHGADRRSAAAARRARSSAVHAESPASTTIAVARTSSVPATMVSQPPTKSHPAQNAAPASMLTASCAQVTASGWTRASTSAPSSGASRPRYQARTRGPTSGAAGPGAAPASGMRASPRSASHTVTATTRVAAAAVPDRQAGATASVPLALDLPAQEGLDPLLGEIVGQLARRVLHQVRGHAQEGAADLPIPRHAAAAD